MTYRVGEPETPGGPKYRLPERPGRLVTKTKIIIKRYADDNARERDDPYSVTVDEGNIGLNEGIGELWDIAIGAGTPTKYDATNARCGVSDNTTAETATQTALVGATALFVSMDSTYPSRSSQTVSWQSTFTGAQANWAWNEFTIDNGLTPNKNLIRKVSIQGTKTAGQSWQLTLQITMS